MQEQQRVPTPFEREIDAVSRFNILEVVMPSQPAIACVRSGFHWIEVTASEVVHAQSALDLVPRNADWWGSDDGQDCIAIAKAFHLERTKADLREPLDTLCETCGQRHCGQVHASGVGRVRRDTLEDRA